MFFILVTAHKLLEATSSLGMDTVSEAGFISYKT